MGITKKGVFGTKTVPWQDVLAIKMDSMEVKVFSDYHGGEVKWMIPGNQKRRYRFADVVMERAPALGMLAWGTGLARVQSPDPGVAELPERVYETVDLVIKGPGRSKLEYEEEHPQYEAIKHIVEERLLPLMEKVRSA